MRTRDAVSASFDGGRESCLGAELDETVTLSLVTHAKPKHYENSLGDVLSGTGLGKEDGLVDNTSVPDAGVERKPESRQLDGKYT